MPNRAEFLRIALDSPGVFEAHFEKHQPESAENNRGQQNVECPNPRQLFVGEDAQPDNIDPRHRPHASGVSQQSTSFHSRRPLMSLIRDKMMLQLQLSTPGSGSMTSRISFSISSLEDATACTWSLFFPVTR